MKIKSFATLIALALLSTLNHQVSTAFGQGTAFTYQGRLNDGTNPANGSYEFEFVLFPTNQSGSPVGPVPVTNLVVTNGLFTTTLDFGSGIFTGTNYWLDIYVRTNGAASFTDLSPRQPITSAPYAIMADRANSLTSLVVQENTNGAPNMIGGSSGNFVSNGVVGATIAGGGALSYYGPGAFTNSVTGDFGTVSGGLANIAGAAYSTVGGGYSNFVGNLYDTVSGGGFNIADGFDATVGGGYGNTATNESATVGGGQENIANGFGATVGGGLGNTAGAFTYDFGATVGGGEANTATNYDSTVSGGYYNTATGQEATVPGGFENLASGSSSFAAGRQARAVHNGAFVWADDNNVNFSSTTTNQFRVRATGGVAFATAIDTNSGNVTAGVHLLAGDTAWSSISDKNAKKNFQSVDGEAVLEKLAAIPVQQWNYKWEADTSTPHIGPMAQDFKGAFYPGRDNKSITTLEFDGVELAAIQGLNQKLEAQAKEKDARINALEKELSELKQAVEKLSNGKD